MDYLFSPSAESLVNRYLRPKIAGEPHDASSFMHDVDVYTDHPYEFVRNRAPAPGTGRGDGRIWYFFNLARHVRNASGRRGGYPNRSGTVGANGKLGTWHSEGKKKTMKGCAAAGYVQNFSYRERTASGFVKPGWLMVEYSISEEDGGCNIVLGKVYKSPRGPGSDVPFRRTSALSGRKRKPNGLERDLSDNRTTPAYQGSEHISGGEPAAPAYQETEHMSGGGEPAASAFQVTEHVSRSEPQLAPGAVDLSGLPLFRQFMETNDDEMAVQVPHDFSYMRYPLGDDLPGAVPPCAAEPEGAAAGIVQTSHSPPANDDKIMDAGITVYKLLASSPGECSALPSQCTDDDDDDVTVWSLACPPMDEAFVKQLLSAPHEPFHPAYVEEFLCDL